MSSSRRRGRSSGSPATGRPAAAVDSAPEAEASQDTAPGEAAEAANEVVEMVTETAAIPEVPAEVSPEAVQAAVAESMTETAEQAVETAGSIRDEAAATGIEATEAAAEQTADAAEPIAKTVQAVQEQAAEQVSATVEQVAEAAMALTAAPLAAAQAVTDAAGTEAGSAESFAKPSAGTMGVRFTFIPTFEPLNEINATLLAFARGEGEAAVAHLQALTKAKTPAEAIRLQVNELQRVADASLTCFSHILRSANRFGGPARWN